MVKAERGIHSDVRQIEASIERGAKPLQMVKAERGTHRDVRQIEASIEKGAKASRW